MAGNTDKICVKSFRADWNKHIPIAALCEKYGITKDQLVRLKKLWRLKPRHDRRLRYKPGFRPLPPTPEEIAAACAAIRAGWDDATEMERRGCKPARVEIQIVDTSAFGLSGLTSGDEE
jgi:hypothetical protein